MKMNHRSVITSLPPNHLQDPKLMASIQIDQATAILFLLTKLQSKISLATYCVSFPWVSYVPLNQSMNADQFQAVSVLAVGAGMQWVHCYWQRNAGRYY